MWRLIYAIPSWILFEILIDIPLMIIGLIVIPIAAGCKAYEGHIEKDLIIYHFTWKFMWLWDNYEDGIANNSYSNYKSMFWRIVSWSAIRNSTNNLRLVPWLSVQIDPKKVCFFGSFINWNDTKYSYSEEKDLINKYDTKIPQWFFCWQGFYSCFYWQFGNLRRFWIGWKIYPTDIYGVTEYRKNGAGFATQPFTRVA